MTCLEKYLKEHPYADREVVINMYCPHTEGCVPDEIVYKFCKKSGSSYPDCCETCWNQEVDETLNPNNIVEELEPLPSNPDFKPYVYTPKSLSEHPKTPIIKDSGDRTEFATGAVRDMREGKGRCDLMPLDVVAAYIEDDNETVDWVLHSISQFQEYGGWSFLYSALNTFAHKNEWDMHTIFLEVAKHFEEGAKKYGENNWQKGIPVKCYIDSAVRHYLKYLRGDKDEPHDRAFVWNILCCIWTCKHHPELNDYAKKEGSEE